MEKELVCPSCGVTQYTQIKHLFGVENAIRDHGDWAECKNCNYQSEIGEFLC